MYDTAPPFACLVLCSFSYTPSILVRSFVRLPYLCSSLAVVSPIRGHIAGTSFPPSPLRCTPWFHARNYSSSSSSTIFLPSSTRSRRIIVRRAHQATRSARGLLKLLSSGGFEASILQCTELHDYVYDVRHACSMMLYEYYYSIPGTTVTYVQQFCSYARTSS